MLNVRVIPVLSLFDGGLVKTTQFKKPHYVGDPINAVRLFNEKEADELAFIDIRASREGREPNYDLIEHIASECFMPFAYGGGIHSLDQAKKIFALGAEKIILNSCLYSNPQVIEKISEIYGEQAVVAAIDVKKNWLGHYQVKARSATQTIKMDIAQAVQHAVNLGAGEIMLNAVHRDGTRQGYDPALYERVAGLVDVPVVALGGAHELDDMRDILKIEGVSDVAAGSFFVFQPEHKAVLITYPKRKEIVSLRP